MQQTSQSPRSVSMVTSSRCLSHSDRCLIPVMILQQVTHSLPYFQAGDKLKKKNEPSNEIMR